MPALIIRGHSDAVFRYGSGCAHGAIAGSEAMVILDGSHSVKVIHPASSTEQPIQVFTDIGEEDSAATVRAELLA